jgi:hypothetical protein
MDRSHEPEPSGGQDDQARPVWEGEDLIDLTKRLLLYSHYKLRRHTSWRGNAAGAPPGALSAADLVQVAFEKYDSEKRPEGVTPSMMLRGIISGEVARVAARVENRYRHDFISASDDPGVIAPELIPDQRQLTIEEQLIARDEANELLGLIQKRFRRDKSLLAYVRLLIAERFASSHELAAALGVSRQKIFNFNRRLARFFRGELQP